MYCLRTYKLTSLLTFFTVCETAIKWDIKGEYVIYGKDATLTCNGKSCPSKSIKKWIGGPNYNLLCFDDYSTKPTKYKMMSNDTRPEFDLMIKGFNFDDASCEYTCSCGFLQYTNMLKLNDSNFIYLPVIEYNSSKQIDNTFQIDLLMKVFPLPTCELFYQNNAITVILTVIKTPSGNDLELYTARIQRTIDLTSYECKGNVSLICHVRSLKHRLLHQHIDFCEFKDELDQHSAEFVTNIIFSVFGILILAATIAFLVYTFVKKNRCNSESENPTKREYVQMALFSNEAEATQMLNLPSSETDATQILNVSSNETGEIPMLNLPSREAESTPMLNLSSNESDATPISNAHKENDNVKYKHSSIDKNMHTKQYDNG